MIPRTAMHPLPSMGFQHRPGSVGRVSRFTNPNPEQGLAFLQRSGERFRLVLDHQVFEQLLKRQTGYAGPHQSGDRHADGTGCYGDETGRCQGADILDLPSRRREPCLPRRRLRLGSDQRVVAVQHGQVITGEAGRQKRLHGREEPVAVGEAGDQFDLGSFGDSRHAGESGYVT